MSERESVDAFRSNGATNATHLLWADCWIEVTKSGDAWMFKTGRDAARWLLWG